MKYHALLVIFEKATNLKWSPANYIGGALRVNIHLIQQNLKNLKILNNRLIQMTPKCHEKLSLFNLIHLLRKFIYTGICVAGQEKSVFVIYERQRRRSDCAYAQSDLRLCCLLTGIYNSYKF